MPNSFRVTPAAVPRNGWIQCLVAVTLVSRGGMLAALGLGPPLLDSGLGDPLDVTVPLHGAAQAGWPERCSWRVTVPPGAPVLREVSARPAAQADAALWVTTARGLREPVVRFNLLVSCGGSQRLSREYTLLLDPPGYAPRPRRAPPPPPAAPRSARPAAPPAAPGSTVTVAPGDTLSDILARHYDAAPDYRAVVEANPQAFVAGDADRLLAGARLYLPHGAVLPPPPPPPAEPVNPSRLRIISPDEEGRYRGLRLDQGLDAARLARALSAPALTTPEPSPAPPGEEEDGVRSSAAVPPAREQVRAAEAAGVAMAAELAAAEERVLAMESEMAGLKERVALLAAAARRAPEPREPPLWGWLAAAALLVVALAVVLAVLANRRRPREEEAIHPPAAITLPTVPASREPAAEAPAAAAARMPAPELSLAPQGGEGQQEEMPARGTAPVVDAEFLNLLEPAGEAERAGDRAAQDEAEGGGRQLERSTTVRLLEVELHLLYEQYEDAREVLESLIEHESSSQPDMRPWAMAFAVFRQTADRDGFDRLSQRFRRRYNVVPPEWDQEAPVPVDLEERYPHLVGRIREVWGTPAAAQFLNELLLDDRGGERQGFEISVAEDISFLRELVAVKEETP